MDVYHLEPQPWLLLALGAFLIGVSKTGIAGVGGLAVAIFANVLPARESTGVVLPLLISADIIAVSTYRQHTVWPHLWRLFPWTIIGVVLGYWAMKHLTNLHFARLIGIMLVVMTLLHLWRLQKLSKKPALELQKIPKTHVFAAIMGILAGFTTMVANAAGPIMILYLLAMRLPKMEFLGTGAWYFLAMNTFKTPFSHQLGLIHSESLELNLTLLPFALGGALGGKFLIHHIQQRSFEIITVALTLIAALRLAL